MNSIPADASDLSQHPAEVRASRYRELAHMHLGYAELAVDTDARVSHLELAALWMRLATQAEHQPGAQEPNA